MSNDPQNVSDSSGTRKKIFGGAALLVALGMGRGLVADPVRPKPPGAATRRSRGFWLMLVCAGLYAVHVGLGAWALTRP